MKKTRTTMTQNRTTERSRRVRFGTGASRLLAVFLVALAVTGSAVASPDGAGTTDEHSQPDTPLVVALEEDGDATVSVDNSFDLTDEADRAAFEALQANETKQAALESRTERRFRAVAAETANETGREMAIEDVSLSFETTDGGDRGVVSVSATWTRFAAADGDRLTVSEPLASGFTADQPVVLKPPEGYELERSTPTPSERTDDRLTWNADASLEGYEAVLVPASDGSGSDGESADGTENGSDDGQPGPGFVVAGASMALGAWLHRRR